MAYGFLTPITRLIKVSLNEEQDKNHFFTITEYCK